MRILVRSRRKREKKELKGKLGLQSEERENTIIGLCIAAKGRIKARDRPGKSR